MMITCRKLGKEGPRVSAIGLGCMGMSHAYGAPADKKEMTELLACAVDMGYTLFDTAEIYGTPANPHDNEELLGRALAPWREQLIIATKFGIRFAPHDGHARPLLTDSRPATIRRSVEGSLRRLHIERIGLYYQHRIDPSVPPEEIAGIMHELIEEGKIAAWGISEANEDVIRRAHRICPLAAVQNRFSMMARGAESLFSILEELEIGFVAFSPLANGLLSGCYGRNARFDPATDYRSAMPQFRPESFDANVELFHLIRQLAADKQATPSQIALAWMLGKKPWIVPIPGTRRLNCLRENAGAADIALSPVEICRIDAALAVMEMSEVFEGNAVLETTSRSSIAGKGIVG